MLIRLRPLILPDVFDHVVLPLGRGVVALVDDFVQDIIEVIHRVDDFTNETLEPQNLYRLRYDLTNEVDTSQFEFPQGATEWKRAAWVPRLVKLRDKLNSNYGEGTHWIEVEEEVDENEERLRLFTEREAERIRLDAEFPDLLEYKLELATEVREKHGHDG